MRIPPLGRTFPLAVAGALVLAGLVAPQSVAARAPATDSSPSQETEHRWLGPDLEVLPLTDDEVLEFLRTASVVEQESISIGINGIERLFRAAEDTKDLALKYCLHPDHEVRREIGAGYTKSNEQDKQIVSMLKHKDARVRRVALSVIHSVHKGTHILPPERLTW